MSTTTWAQGRGTGSKCCARRRQGHQEDITAWPWAATDEHHTKRRARRPRQAAALPARLQGRCPSRRSSEQVDAPTSKSACGQRRCRVWVRARARVHARACAHACAHVRAYVCGAARADVRTCACVRVLTWFPCQKRPVRRRGPPFAMPRRRWSWRRPTRPRSGQAALAARPPPACAPAPQRNPVGDFQGCVVLSFCSWFLFVANSRFTTPVVPSPRKKKNCDAMRAD